MLRVGGDSGLPGKAAALTPLDAGHALCIMHTSHSHLWGIAQGPGYAPGIRVTADRTNQPFFCCRSLPSVWGQPGRRGEVASCVATIGKAQRLTRDAQRRSIWAGSSEASQVRPQRDIEGVPGGDSMSQALILDRKAGPGKVRR